MTPLDIYSEQQAPVAPSSQHVHKILGQSIFISIRKTEHNAEGILVVG